MTPHMQADAIAYEFNGATERGYWKAYVGGTRNAPAINFNSRSSNVKISFHIKTGRFTVEFESTVAYFGDFMSSITRALRQITTALKAIGLEIQAPLDPDDGVLRLEYDSNAKVSYIHLGKLDDDWRDVQPYVFKAHEKIIFHNASGGVDVPSE